ncbi:MAG: carboxypeptidase-like regulatory domain-containing protein [Pirellulaceae bacterium]
MHFEMQCKRHGTGFYALSLACALSLVGCSSDDRPEGVSVSGIVTYQGQPVDGADVAFSPLEGSGAGGFARTDAEGQFELSSRNTSAGVLPGAYRVKISKISVKSDWTQEQDPGVRPKQTETSELPKQYAGFATSGLTAEVVAQEENEFQFDLSN